MHQKLTPNGSLSQLIKQQEQGPSSKKEKVLRGTNFVNSYDHLLQRAEEEKHVDDELLMN